MNLIGSLALLGVAVVLLYFGRGRDGDALPIFQNWIVGMLFILGGLMGVAVNPNWLH